MHHGLIIRHRCPTLQPCTSLPAQACARPVDHPPLTLDPPPAWRPARAALTATALPDVVGRLDWRVQNLAFAGSQVSAIYDWDSVGLVPEPALVGSSSVIHPVDWRLEQPDPLPTLEQVDGFVADYESTRGAPFDDDERAVLAAGQQWVVSFGARCQHSDDLLCVVPDVDHSRGWPRLLRDLLGQSIRHRPPAPQ